MKNKLLALVLLPLIYIRYSFLIMIPVYVYIEHVNLNLTLDYETSFLLCFVIWSCYATTVGFVFANLELLEPLINFVIKIFKIPCEYKYIQESFFIFAYDKNVLLKRRALMYYLFTNKQLDENKA